MDTKNCKKCYQIKCVCDPIFEDIYSLNGYTNDYVSDIATPLKLTITTFVFVIGTKKEICPKGGTVSGIKVDLGKIGNYMDNAIDKNIEEEKSGYGKEFFDRLTIFTEYTVPKRSANKDMKSGKTMYNQISIKGSFLEDRLTVQSNINVMVFTNGSVKVVGVRNPASIQKICFYVLDLLLKSNSITKEEENKQIKIWGIRTSMINTVFKIKKDDPKQKQLIRQKELKTILEDYVGKNKPISDIVNRKDKGSQMNIKFKGYGKSEEKVCTTRKGRKKTKNEVTILSFSTGSLSIIGTNNPQNIRDAYDFICKTIKDSPRVFLKPKVRNR